MDCDAVSSWLGSIMRSIQTSIDEAACDWCSKFDASTSHEIHQMGPSGKRRKRMNPAYTEALGLRVIQEGRAHSAEGVLRAVDPTASGHGQGQRAEALLLRQSQASSWLTFTDAYVMALCLDGIRVGNPCKELLSIFFWHGRKRLASVGPPMVCCLHRVCNHVCIMSLAYVSSKDPSGEKG